MEGRGKLREDVKIDALEAEGTKGDGPAAIEEILADVSKDRLLAARKTLDYLGCKQIGATELMAGARRLIFNKGTDSHDYKFSSAVMEDFYHVSKNWRGPYLASSMFQLRGAGDKDNDLVRRARAVLAKG